MIRCWHDESTDEYLLTPGWWDEVLNEKRFPDKELVPCKSPALTHEVRLLEDRMVRYSVNIWMSAECYYEQTEGVMKKQNEGVKKYLKNIEGSQL